MRFDRLWRFGATAALVLILYSPLTCVAQGPQGSAPPDSAFFISPAQLIQPEELNRMLQAKGADKPLVLQVGSHVLFAESHIQGSEYAGPGSQPSGLELLQQRVASLPKTTSIVLYCGCCPWNHCPNVGPAFKHLQDMGFSHVKVLYLANNFGADWVNKGYPVEHGR
jgi:hypothetical protein